MKDNKKIVEKFRNILEKENFIIKQHFECHSADVVGFCKTCNRRDTVTELNIILEQALSSQRAEWKKKIKKEMKTRAVTEKGEINKTTYVSVTFIFPYKPVIKNTRVAGIFYYFVAPCPKCNGIS